MKLIKNKSNKILRINSIDCEKKFSKYWNRNIPKKIKRKSDNAQIKQTINTNNTTSLLDNLNNFVNLYFDDHGKKHLRELNWKKIYY